MRHTSDGMTISPGLVAILRHEDGVVLVQQQGDDLPLFERCCKLKWKES